MKKLSVISDQYSVSRHQGAGAREKLSVISDQYSVSRHQGAGARKKLSVISDQSSVGIKQVAEIIDQLSVKHQVCRVKLITDHRSLITGRLRGEESAV